MSFLIGYLLCMLVVSVAEDQNIKEREKQRKQQK